MLLRDLHVPGDDVQVPPMLIPSLRPDDFLEVQPCRIS